MNQTYISYQLQKRCTCFSHNMKTSEKKKIVLTCYVMQLGMRLGILYAQSHFYEAYLELTLILMRPHHLLIYQQCTLLVNNRSV